MHLIIEGPNRTGKSELIKLIQEVTDNRYIQFYDRDIRNKFHETKMAMTNLQTQLETMLKFMELAKEDEYIFDRYHISEVVYGLVDRGYNNLSDIRKIDYRLSELNVKMIMLNDSPRSIYKRMYKPEDRYNECDYERVKQIHEHYTYWEDFTKIKTLKMNWGLAIADKSQAVEEILNFIKE